MISTIIAAALVFGSSESAAYLSTVHRHSRRWISSQHLANDEGTNHYIEDIEDGALYAKLPSYQSLNSGISRSSFFTAVAMAALAIPMDDAAGAIPESDTSPPTSATSTYSFVENEMKKLQENILETSSTLVTTSESSSLQESISGFIAGGALAGTKTLVKYPLDTVTVRLQMPASEYSITELGRLFGGSYNGVTLSLLSNIPGGAVFFAVKDAVKASLKTAAWTSAAPKWVTTTMAVGAAMIPYWIIRNPSEVIKVRQQAGIPGYGLGVSAWDAIRLTLNETTANGGSMLDGVGNFYTGYWENVVYGLPSDVIKFVAYEALTGGRKDLSPLEGAQAGAFATAAAQLITTPLDVIRNRLMTGTDSAGRGITVLDEERIPKDNYVQSLITLGREEGLRGLFAGATPRVAKAFLSGAIQFATYEETKQSIARMLQQRR